MNPFHATDLFLYPLKTSENLWFSGGIERDQLREMGLCEVILLPSRQLHVQS